MKKFLRWLWPPYRRENARLESEWNSAHRANDELLRQIAHLKKERQWLRAQLMNLRVSQAEAPRRGWEVMAYIPQDTADRLGWYSGPQFERFCRGVADTLVSSAVTGLVHVNSQGRVNALVFAPVNMNGKPAAPKYLQVLFEKDGKFKMSEKVHNLLDESEETRVKRASGL